MKFIIEKQEYFDVDKISILKAYKSRVIESENLGKAVNGVIELNISYLNTMGEECFNTLNLDFDVDLKDYEIIEINVKSLKIFVIESNGVNVEYEIEVIYDVVENKIIEPIIMDEVESLQGEIIEPIIIENVDTNQDKNILEEEVNIEKIKDDISKDYENKLIDSLNRSTDNTIKIIRTKDKNDEFSFSKLFSFEERGYSLIKTLYCPNTEVLNDIAKMYKINFKTLLKGYDKENNKVTFIMNE